MTEIEKKALALVNEVRAAWGRHRTNVFIRGDDDKIEALCRVIEQHEAFRREVSDAVGSRWMNILAMKCEDVFARFIIAKPDPLVDAMLCAWPQYADRMDACNSDANTLRAALAARGGRIVWEGE